MCFLEEQRDHMQGRVGSTEEEAVSFLCILPVHTSDTIHWHFSFLKMMAHSGSLFMLHHYILLK